MRTIENINDAIFELKESIRGMEREYDFHFGVASEINDALTAANKMLKDLLDQKVIIANDEIKKFMAVERKDL